MIPEFVDFLDIAIKELQTEDDYLRGAVAANPATYPPNGKDSLSGLLRFNNERYYQYVVAKGLLRSSGFAVELERKNRSDLILARPGTASPLFAVVEMKLWMSPEGEKEIRPIESDIRKLLNLKGSGKTNHALMLVFSANLRQTMKIKANLLWLSNKLDSLRNRAVPRIRRKDWEYRFFPTFNNEGEPVYFWIAGYEVF